MKFKKILLSLYIAFSVIFIFNMNAYATTTSARLSGQNRYKTAIAISKAGWQTSENLWH